MGGSGNVLDGVNRREVVSTLRRPACP